MNVTEDKITEVRKMAHEFSRSIMPSLITPATTEILKYTLTLVEEKRLDAQKTTNEAIQKAITDDEKTAIANKSVTDFLEYQRQLVSAASANIRQVVWTVAGGLTGDYFPELLEAEKLQAEQKKQANGDTAQDDPEAQPRVSILQGDPVVDPGEVVPSAPSGLPS